MSRYFFIALALFACLAAAALPAASARAEVLVTVFAGQPGGAGNGTPNLSLAGLPQLGTFAYGGLNFDAWSRFGNSGNGDWVPLYRPDNYTARIIGQFQVATTGTYAFGTRSDDGSVLRIDGNVVVNNNFYQGPTTRTGNAFLAAGIHNFEVLFFEGGGGSSLTVGSAADPQNLPAGVTIVNHINFPQLQVDVYAGQRWDQGTGPNGGALVNPATPLLGSFIAPDVNFDYATGSRWSPFGRGDDYSASARGMLFVAADGNYNFGLNSDDGSWLFIDGVRVVNNGGFHGSNQAPPFGNPQATGATFLTAGLHPFEVRMFEAGGGSGVNLYFLTPGVRYATFGEVAGLPEPSTFALAAIGVAGCLFAVYRHRRQSKKANG